MRFALIAKHRHIWPVSWLCDVLDVSRSGFHAWLNRPTVCAVSGPLILLLRPACLALAWHLDLVGESRTRSF